MARQHPERRHQDSLGLLLIHRLAAPALTRCPLANAALQTEQVVSRSWWKLAEAA
jgi:hypothetical protein